ncbi:MAG: hypothetical protein PF961_23135 [Planctomycetota bacterium]|jgi:hypothetical protein|nr:hypothetical protein [Planctomycetota bacterium]
MDATLDCGPLLGHTGPMPVCGLAGDEQGVLHAWSCEWACADAPLAVTLVGAEPIVPIAGDATEPVASALARLTQYARGYGAIVALGNPGAALGPERMALAQGVRLFAFTTAEDEACWDAALSAGLPVYGLRDQLRIDLGSARRRDAGAALLSLAYGLFTCGQGLVPAELEETRSGVRWRFDEPVTASVIVRGGFEANTVQGDTGSWTDRGTEGYVRLAFTAGQRRCWSQPRLVMAGSAHG